METKDAGEETMERNNRASQKSQRVVQLKEEEEVLGGVHVTDVVTYVVWL